MHRWKLAFPRAQPVYRRRRRRALTADRIARRGNPGVIAGPSRLERSAPMAIVPLTVGQTLLMVLLLSAGFLALIWGALELLVSALG